MKRIVTVLAAAALVAGISTMGFAAQGKAEKSKKSAPVQLTAAQMDQVTAGSANGSVAHDNTSSGKTNYVGDNSGSNYKRAEGTGSSKNSISD